MITASVMKELKIRFGSFFEQDHMLNFIILGVYAKRGSKCARISK